MRSPAHHFPLPVPQCVLGQGQLMDIAGWRPMTLSQVPALSSDSHGHILIGLSLTCFRTTLAHPVPIWSFRRATCYASEGRIRPCAKAQRKFSVHSADINPKSKLPPLRANAQPRPGRPAVASMCHGNRKETSLKLHARCHRSCNIEENRTFHDNVLRMRYPSPTHFRRGRAGPPRLGHV